MSKPDWTALADRYGAQEAQYNAPNPDDDWEYCGECMARVPGGIPDGMCICEDCARRLGLTDQHGDAPPAIDLLTASRAHQDAGAAQDGQASIALALGTWLALVVAFALLAMCVYGAAWVNGVWLAPFAGLAR